MTHLTRRAVLGGSLGLAGLAVAGTHRPAFAADVPRPDLIGCGTWGAESARGSIKMVGPPTKIVIHHTASDNVTDDSKSAAYDIARQIQGWHFDNGWADSGQHFTVSRGGYILEGRHRTLEGLKGGKQFPQGAHATGANPTSLGIENQGTYTDEVPPAKQWDALVGLCAYLCQTYGLSADALVGHRDVSGSSTACPGDAFHAKLPQLRKDVAAKLGDGGGGGRSWPTLKSGAKGFRVTALQHLLSAADQDVKAGGTFDDATTAAVEAFQKAKKLTVDGVVGRLTWEAPLAVKLRDGSKGEAVKGLQVALKERGQDVVIDGVFGSATTTAVKGFQRSASLVEDGVAGLDTWSHLLRS